jgi:hypothetical protein
MRIGVDASCWGNKRGFGRFTRELLDALVALDDANEYLFFVDSETEDLNSIPPSVRKIVAATEFSQVKAAAAGGRRSLGDVWSMSRSVLEHKIDVFSSPRFILIFRYLTEQRSFLRFTM